MKKKIILLMVTFCLMFGITGAASAREIHFENHTDFHWVGLYINYDGQRRTWSENLLAHQVMRGDEVTVDVHGTNKKMFKIKVIERNHGKDYKVIWHDVNLEDAWKVVMFYDRKSGNTSYRVLRNH